MTGDSTKKPPYRDENGAGVGWPAEDPVSGKRYFLEPNGERTYQHGECPRCGIWYFSAKPDTKECGCCLPGRVPANDEAGLDDASDLPDEAGDVASVPA